MFGSKNTKTNFEQVETIVGKETKFNGSITAKGTIRIDGKLEGEVVTTGDVIIGQTAELQAQIKARSTTIAGTVTGNVVVEDKLELLKTGKLYGDVKVGSLIIGEGAVFKGACEMQRPGALPIITNVATNASPAAKKDK